MKSYRCSQCQQDILEDDLIIMIEKPGVAVCPICANDIKLDDDDIFDADNIVAAIIEKWGIDEFAAAQIVDKNQSKLLTNFMFITEDGDVFNADDEDALRLEMLQYLLDEDQTINSIEYVFIDGCAKSIELDINFNEVEEEEEYKGNAPVSIPSDTDPGGRTGFGF